MKITTEYTGAGERYVINRTEGGRRRRSYFKDHSSAEAALKLIRDRTRKEGNLFASYSEAERFQMVSALERAREMGTTLSLALDGLVKARHTEELRRVELGCYDPKDEEGYGAVQECVEEKVARNYRKRSVQSLSSTLNRFSGAHPRACVGDITGQTIFRWLDNGRKSSGKPWSSRTKNGYLTDITTLFSWCLKRKLIDSNPADDVDDFLMTQQEEREMEERVEIILPDQLGLLMRAALRLDKGVARLLSFIYFAGLRPEREAGMMQESYISDQIYVPPRLAKDRQERFFTPHPTLKTWLDATTEAVLPLDNRAKRIAAAVKAAGLVGEIPRNAGRHSFASYHLVLHGKGATLDVLGHGSDQMLFSNYRSAVTREMAENYFDIKPI